MLFGALALASPPLKTIPQSEPQAKAEAKRHARQFVANFRKDVKSGRLSKIAPHVDRALDMMVDKGTKELRARGFKEDADRFDAEWAFHFRGFLTRASENERDIGDHKPLSEWLAKFYDKLEFLLGVTICKSLHLSDIKSINYCLPVVFHPCSFNMDSVSGERKDEYRRHFAAGDVYYGLVPVVVYWLINIPCTFGTSGIGLFICGPAASVGEYLIGKFVAPKLSDKIYSRACEEGFIDAELDY